MTLHDQLKFKTKINFKVKDISSKPLQAHIPNKNPNKNLNSINEYFHILVSKFTLKAKEWR